MGLRALSLTLKERQMANPNPENRYRVIYPGGQHAKGYEIDFVQYIKDAREIRDKCSHPLAYIWDDVKGEGVK
jgi:hypothetical protein